MNGTSETSTTSTVVLERGERVRVAGDELTYYVQHVHPAGHWVRLRDLSGRYERDRVDPAELELVPDWTCPDSECAGAVLTYEGAHGPDRVHRWGCERCGCSWCETTLVKRVVLVVLRAAFGHAPMVRPGTCRYCGPGPCRSTAFTASGRDLEAFERAHGGRR